MVIPRTVEELQALAEDEFLVTFLLIGDQAELLPKQVCGIEVARSAFTEDNRLYLKFALGCDASPSWFDPGLYGLSLVVKAADKQSAAREAWLEVRSASSFLGTYIRQPREGLDLQRERLVTPTGWVIIWNQGRWELATYHTWLLMSVSLPSQLGKPERQYDENLFWRLAEASNDFWAANQRQEDRLRVERATTWYSRSVSAIDYATMLLHGWMAIVPLVIAKRENSGLMLDRLLQLAACHGHSLDRGFLEEVRDARNEIAHEGSMANADPLAVDAAHIAPYLQPLRLLFIMALLFVLEAAPLDGPLLEKWDGLDAYVPTVVVDGSSLPEWHSVPEIFGSIE